MAFLNRLSSWYGISGFALKWFLSYVTDRSQSVIIQNVFFRPGCHLTRRLARFSQIIANHDASHNLYADDTLIYISLSCPKDFRFCLQSVSIWMAKSKRKLNLDKTISYHWIWEPSGEMLYIVAYFIAVSWNITKKNLRVNKVLPFWWPNCGGVLGIVRSSTSCPHPGRVIRDLFPLLHAVRHGTEALVYISHPREAAVSYVAIIFGWIASGVPWLIL